MNTALARAVIQSLSYSRDAEEKGVAMLPQFGERDWDRSFCWLDNSGLALYFLHRLQEAQQTSVLPHRVLARLQRNHDDNQYRVMRMAEDFGRINRKFDKSGLNYAVMKGFSLVPQFCPDVSLRAQADLDYMVDDESLPVAQRVLAEFGYLRIQATPTQFVFRGKENRAQMSDSPYAFTTKPMVELHLAVWDTSNTQIRFAEPRLSLDRKRISEYDGLKFPVLSTEDSFLLQIIHVFQHILCCWIRLSWLLELGHFLNQRNEDIALWEKMDWQFQPIDNLCEFAAVVIGLTTKAFGASFPPRIRKWNDRLRPASRLWLENYGSQWLLSDHPYHESGLFPPTKLVLFLHQEYISDPEIREQVRLQRIFPWKRPPKIAQFDRTFSKAPASREEWSFRIQRIYHHVGAGLRYAWEVPRWRKLNACILASPRTRRIEKFLNTK